MNVFRWLLDWFLGRDEPRRDAAPIGTSAPSPSPESPHPPAVPPGTSEDPYFSTAAGPGAEPVAKKAKSLGLDAGAFLPISRSEIKQAARGRSLFANAWFGLRDRIPPVSDPRTLLIDRAMVTHGLLTPEQLAEIHAVGDEMERVRPMLSRIEAQAARHGEAAVEASREEKARLKERRKAEAAERRRKQAEEIAHRRATDIIFLGRGVSNRLNDRRSDLDALAALGLPALSTPAELAEALGLTIPRLRWLAFHTDVATRTHYVRFEVPKRSGGTRTLCAPHRTLAAAQEWILANIVAKRPVEDPAHGFVPGRSILTNARQHVGRAVVVNMDLKDFFPSVTFPRVRSVFQQIGYSPAVATILALLCTECPRRPVQYDGATYHVATGPRGLPQGACTSPGLSNQVARRLDRRLGGLAAKLDLAYTRYADDLTFSGDLPRDRIGYLMARVRHIADDEGFAVNGSKTRVLGRHAAQTVTGLVVNDRPGVPRDEVRRLRAILHRARHEGLARQNRDGRDDFLAYLRGKIAYVSMSRPEVGARLRGELDAILAGRGAS